MLPSTFNLFEYTASPENETHKEIDSLHLICSGPSGEIEDQVNSLVVSNALSVLFEHPWINCIDFCEGDKSYILQVDSRANPSQDNVTKEMALLT
jgi:hypothetical protein